MNVHFKLSKEDHDAIYEQRIEPDALEGNTPVEKPQAVLLGGQMGAGKSTIDHALEQKFDNNFVRISTDELRKYHPDHIEIGKLDDKLFGQHTHPDASPWQSKLFDRASEQGYNIRYEGSLQDPAGTLNRLADLKEKGYSVEVQIVATHERESSLSIYKRYEDERLENGYGRYVPQEMHDKSYAMLPETIKQIEEHQAADRIQIFNRQGECLHDNRLEDGRWTNPGSADALQKGRDIELTPEQIKDYADRWQERVFKPMEERGAPQEEIDKVKAIADHYQKELGLDIDRFANKHGPEDRENRVSDGPTEKPPQQNVDRLEGPSKLDPGRDDIGHDNRLLNQLYNRDLKAFDIDLVDREISNDLRSQVDSICDPLGLAKLPELAKEIDLKQIGQDLIGPDRVDMLANPPDWAKNFEPEYKWITGTDPELANKLWGDQNPQNLKAEIDKQPQDRADADRAENLFNSHKQFALDHGKEISLGPVEGKVDRLETHAQQLEADRADTGGLRSGPGSTAQQFGYGVDTMSSGHSDEKKQHEDPEIGDR